MTYMNKVSDTYEVEGTWRIEPEGDYLVKASFYDLDGKLMFCEFKDSQPGDIWIYPTNLTVTILHA